MEKCAKARMARSSVNDLVLWDYDDYVKTHWREVPVTKLREEGTRKIQKRIERMIVS